MAIDKQPAPQNFLLEKSQAQELEHSWMRCPSGKIPGLFSACCANGAGQYETHRAIAYSMPTKELQGVSRKNGQDSAANSSVGTYEFSNPCPPICGGGNGS